MEEKTRGGNKSQDNIEQTTVLYGNMYQVFDQILGIWYFVDSFFVGFLEDFGGDFWRIFGGLLKVF